MTEIPNVPLIGPVVALTAGVVDHRDGAPMERLRAAGERAAEAMVAHSPAQFVAAQAFVAACLAEMVAEARGIPVEEVLMMVLEAGQRELG